MEADNIRPNVEGGGGTPLRRGLHGIWDRAGSVGDISSRYNIRETET